MKSRLALIALSLLLACNDTNGPEDRRIEVVSGGDQVAGSATTLQQPVIVRVLDSNGNPIRDTEVRWLVIEGGGRVSDDVTRTDANGQASVTWTLGSANGLQLLLATSGTGSLSVRARGRFEITAIAAGFRHTCGVGSTGQVYCWGAGEQGQLGNAAALNSSVPVRVQSNVAFKSITAGWVHTCALSVGAAAFCWGDNRVGQLGITGQLSGYAIPMPVRFGDAFNVISAGFVHTCGANTEGDVVCWGNNDRGQLSGAQPGSGRISGARINDIAAGEFHTCSVRNDGVGVCWGWNSRGEIGANAAPEAVVATPVAVSGPTRFNSIAAGPRHSCGISTDGQAWCWGLNGSGELGYDPFVNPTVPAVVAGAAGFTDLGIGNAHTCGISAQRVYCWGAALFNGTSIDTKTPTPLNTALQFRAISVGYEHTCGIAEGEVWCWGSNSHGQLGQSGIQSSATPVRVPLSGQ